VSHSTLHRLVKNQEFELPTSKQGVQEITLDGGKVRLRNENKGEPCYWKDYKTLCLDNVYCGSFFQNNQDLIDWSNSQKLLHPMYCIGDGHPGIWNLFQEIGVTEQRQEILDWYHLKENLYKAGGSLKRLKQAETLLWFGQVNEVINLFKELKRKGFKTFCNYLEFHRNRIVNYRYYKEESLSSIGSGTVESTIKRIGLRVNYRERSGISRVFPLSFLCAVLISMVNFPLDVFAKVRCTRCSLLVLSMARGFSKAVTSQQKQTDSWPSMNILNASFLEHFANLNDPRIERSKEHLLKDIRSIAILAVISGADGWVAIESYGNAKYEWLQSFLELTEWYTIS
jgi:hypothetical protein